MEKDELKKRKKEFINNHINRAQIDKLFVDSLTLSNFGSILNEPIIDFGALVITSSILKDSLRLMKEYIIYYWNNYNLDNSYHKKDDYKKLKVLYEEYVKNIANYFKKIGLNDIISIATYFSYLVKQSGLSCTNEFELKNVNDTDILKCNLIGSNVVLGKGCCRHLSILLSDIYKELGFESETLLVKAYNTNFIHFYERILKYINHAVVIVNDSKGNIVVDPTNSLIGKINNKKNSTCKIIDFKGIKEKDKFDFVCSFDGKFASNIKDDTLIINNNSRDLSQEELNSANEFVDEIKHNIPINDFKDKNKKLIKELSLATIKMNS